MTAGAAQALGNAALARYTAASWSGPFQAAPGQYLTMGGAPVDLGCEHAGEVCRLILADGPYGGEVNPAPPVQFPVGKYEYNDITGLAQITPYQAWTADLAAVTGRLTPAAPKPKPAPAKKKLRWPGGHGPGCGTRGNCGPELTPERPPAMTPPRRRLRA